MSLTAASYTPPNGVSLALRFAARELRGGLRGFYVFIACIALGVMSIAGVGSLASSLSNSLGVQGRVILGGDVSFSRMHQPIDADERAFLERRGAISAATTLRGMARTTDGRPGLAEIKAVDDAYPLTGTVQLEPAMPLAQALAEKDGAFGAVAAPDLLTRLSLKPGDRVTLGSATLEIRAALASEPDKLAAGIGFGPRLLISDAALRASALAQPGSLVRYLYRLRLPDANASEQATKDVVTQTRAQFPEAGFEIRTRTNASPQIERNVDRFTQFLTIVGLTALLVGGVGVGNAVRSHLDRKRDTIATLKALGASGGRVFGVYLVQVVVLALIGGAIGAALGAALPYLVAWGFGAIIPLPIEPSVQPGDLALAVLYGLLVSLAFALWPLGRAHDVPVAALFRDGIAPEARWPRRRYIAATVLATAVLIAIAVGLAYDRKVAMIYVAVAVAVFLLLRIVASGLMRFAAGLPRSRWTGLRMAIANIHRPRALTPAVVMSLGLGLALLVTVIEIDGNLRKQFSASLPEKAPAFFFLDIPSDEAEKFDAFVKDRASDGKLEDVPMLRGRVISARGVAAEDLKPKQDVAWVLQSDRGITYAAEAPQGSRLVAGEWWPKDYSGPALVSFEKKIAEGLGLGIGDDIVVNVLGRNISARIANLREVDWQNLGINFVLVYSPNTFSGAPHTHMASLTFPPGVAQARERAQEDALIREVADKFPSVTSVRVKDALEAFGGIVNNLVLAVRGASVITLIAAALVLGGALAAGHRHRVYDAVILKTLGATRRRLIGAYALEYLMLAAATGVFGVLAGSLAAWWIITALMNLGFTWLPVPALVATFGAIAVTVIIGLAGTLRALSQKPAPVLRHL
jgi:putative ABC transport system permease protein